MWLDVEIQRPYEGEDIPKDGNFRHWCEEALLHRVSQAEVVIRIVDESESQELNRNYRGIDGPTNVLSFNFDPPEGFESQHLGDIVICAPVVAREAQDQDKSPEAHWAHMVIHGLLHLLGFDHQDELQAQEMERTETQILNRLGFQNPYAEELPA
ncbi:MAG: rRNA maturation RNase YbeY [bacterium]